MLPVHKKARTKTGRSERVGETLWRAFDQEALDTELNLRQRTPEHVEFFSRWAAESAVVRCNQNCRLDLAYGDQESQTLDLFLPANKPAPLLTFVHGGYWQSLDKGDFSFLAPAFVSRGIAFASLNYTLAPNAPIDQMVEEVRQAVAWLFERSGDYGVDAEQIAICGHSAGGHLACMAHSADWSARLGETTSPLRFCCSVSGIYQLEPLRHSYQQDVLRIDPASVSKLSPQSAVPEASVGPLVLAVGSEEPSEFIAQQAEYLTAWRAAGHIGQEISLPGRHHFSAVEALSEADHPLYSAVCALFDQQSA